MDADRYPQRLMVMEPYMRVVDEAVDEVAYETSTPRELLRGPRGGEREAELREWVLVPARQLAVVGHDVVDTS